MKKLLGVLLFASIFFNSCKKENSRTEQQAGLDGQRSNKTNSSLVNSSSAVATDWYKLQVRMMLNANPATNGALNAEAFAYIGIGLYESVRSGIKNSISFSSRLYQMPEMPQPDNNGYDLVVTANAALASLVRYMYPAALINANKSSIDSLENSYNENVLLSMESAKFQRSQTYGRAIATAIYNWSKTDSYNVGNSGYVLPTTPVGVYIPTPPAFGTPILPFVSFSRPLLFEDGTGVAPPPPFAYSELSSSDFYKMAKDLYDVSKVLTKEQTDMALYWNDAGVGIGYTPQGHMMNVVTQAVEQTGVDLGVAAKAYAKAGIAIRESQLTCFRSKYEYLQMRPVSYIRKVIDPTWSPLITTPAHPEYPAAHAYVTGATLRAAASELGANVPVVDHTYDFRGFEPRHFSSLDAVSDESGLSRRYGGIHYMPSIIVGWSEGRKLGMLVGSIKLEE